MTPNGQVYGDYKQPDSPDEHAGLEDVLESPELVGCVTSEPAATADSGSHLNDSDSAIDKNALLTGEIKQ